VFGAHPTSLSFVIGLSISIGGRIVQHAGRRYPLTLIFWLRMAPPLGHGDLCSSEQRAGCVDLLRTVVERVKPKIHIFGHIHEGYGVTTNGETTFINASTCTLRYKPIHPPVVIDIPATRLIRISQLVMQWMMRNSVINK